MESNRHKFIVGIDYGTTFCGIAIGNTASSNINDIHVVNSWCGDGSIGNFDKVPSQIAYDGNETVWGYGVESLNTSIPRYQWTKLLLQSKADIPWLDIQSLQGEGYLTTPPDKTPQMVVTDYLSKLYNHMWSKLTKLYGCTLLDTTPIQFVITVPAIWTDEAKIATRQAAEKAGFGSRRGDTISMILEPEAAALWALRSLHGTSQLSPAIMKEGEQLVICDAGGGTVDLITYKVVSVNPTLRLKESVIGNGALCGSTFIDRDFHDLLRRHLGSQYDELSSKKKGPGSRLMKEFEIVKRRFDTTYLKQGFSLPLNLPDNKEANISDGEIHFTYDEIKGIFDRVVNEIIDLVSEQVRAAEGRVSTVILVGGFGQSQYLYSRLKDWGRGQNLEIINPPKSWSAIARGAVIHNLETQVVVSRKSRSHYGIPMATPFIAGQHNEIFSIICPFTKRRFATDSIQWFIRKGEDVSEARAKEIKCYGTFTAESNRKFKYDLLRCNLDDAPESIHSYRLDTVGILETDLSVIPLSRFPSIRDRRGEPWWKIKAAKSGKKYYKADFYLCMSVYSGEIHFEYEYGGKTRGVTKLIANAPVQN